MENMTNEEAIMLMHQVIDRLDWINDELGKPHTLHVADQAIFDLDEAPISLLNRELSC